MSPNRTNLTLLKSCGPTAPDDWSAQLVDPGSASYSSVGIRHVGGGGAPKLYVGGGGAPKLYEGPRPWAKWDW